MKYFGLILKDKMVKTTPQIEVDSSFPYNFRQSYSIWNLRSGKKAHADFKLPRFILKKSCKLTDILDAVCIKKSFSMLCSKAFLETLNKFKTSEFQCFSTIVSEKDLAHEYFFLHFYEDYDSYIDFENSDFFIPPPSIKANHPEEDYKPISIRSSDEYVRQKEEFISIGVKKLKLKHDIELDLFRVNIGKINFFISERLKNALLRAGQTGFSFYDSSIGNNIFIMDGRIHTT
ncbi:MAG: hypothetical protein H6564_16340 [Lewinellaceae bacterium]|nr:hypothetical protein [Lewinellaceae bacterium]